MDTFAVQPRKNPADLLILHDNARRHKSLATIEAITKMGWAVLPCPPYSPDLTLYDFHLFSLLEDEFRGGKFKNYEGMIHMQRKNSYVINIKSGRG